MYRLILAVALACAALPAFAQTVTKNAQILPLAPVATACCTLATGGTAQNFQNATSNSATATQSPGSCLIVNGLTAADQGGIGAAEAIWVNVLGAATTSAGGTSVPIQAGGNMVIYPATNAISWNAATTWHKISGYCWQ